MNYINSMSTTSLFIGLVPTSRLITIVHIASANGLLRTFDIVTLESSLAFMLLAASCRRLIREPI
jgi:hypothetical protein